MRQLIGVGIASLLVGGLVWALAGDGSARDSAELLTDPHAVRDPLEGGLVEQDEGYLALLAPTAPVDLEPQHESPLAPLRPGQLYGLAFQYDSPIYSSPGRGRPAGIMRRGKQVRLGELLTGGGCKGGEWYRLVDTEGVVCTADGFQIGPEPQDFHIRQVFAATHRSMPFRYGKVNSRQAVRYYDLPTPEQQAAAEAAARGASGYPKVAERRMEGDYLVAIDRLEGPADRQFVRTIRGRYVRRDRIDPKPMPSMVGERISGREQLPLAFIFGDETVPLLSWRDGRLREVGVAEKHARFLVEGEELWSGVPVVVGARGFAVPRKRVRIARTIPRPSSVPTGQRFVHVNLTEQTLVAYDGDGKPVFATLISSGKEGHDTPTGTYRINDKHISTTMRGSDPHEGYYEVEEVPWTMFYYEAYALHGAYWHNDFGKVRSHGCTNLSPIDARFLFYWTSPDVPQEWNGLRDSQVGTYVVMTRDEAG